MEEQVVEQEAIRFPYQVNTRMPIVGLSVGDIKSPKTLELTKEDVLICVKKAPVFRRFRDGKLVRVGAYNLDRLHNEEFIDEKEWELLGDKRGEVIVPTVSEKKETEVVKEEPKVEEKPQVVEEAPVEEEVVAETVEEAQTEETTEESTEVVNDEEEVSEEVTEEETTSEDGEESNSFNNNIRYKNKKKHNR